MDAPKVTFGKTIVICGEDWQVRIFGSASQPRHPERSYWVLTETPYDETLLEMLTESEINARLSEMPGPPNSLEDVLRSGNIARTMREYVFPPLTPYTLADF